MDGRSYEGNFLNGLKDGQGKVLNGVREKVGELFSCAPNRVALVPNFSYGLNTLLEGIPTTQKVLLLKVLDLEQFRGVRGTRQFFQSSIHTICVHDLVADVSATEQPFHCNLPPNFVFLLEEMRLNFNFVPS